MLLKMKVLYCPKLLQRPNLPHLTVLYGILVYNGSGNGLVIDNIEPLPESMFTTFHRDVQEYTNISRNDLDVDNHNPSEIIYCH